MSVLALTAYTLLFTPEGHEEANFVDHCPHPYRRYIKGPPMFHNNGLLCWINALLFILFQSTAYYAGDPGTSVLSKAFQMYMNARSKGLEYADDVREFVFSRLPTGLQKRDYGEISSFEVLLNEKDSPVWQKYVKSYHCSNCRRYERQEEETDIFFHAAG